MPFGLTNVLSDFYQFIKNIFFNFLNVYVMIYLDNILIYSNNISKHCWHIKKVLNHLHKAGLYTKAKICEFYSESVKYL